MKTMHWTTSVFFLTLCCTMAQAQQSLRGRKILSKYECPNYKGPRHIQKDLEIEVTFLSARPSEEQLQRYDGLEKYTIGTLFATAVVRFTSKLKIEPSTKYFKVSYGKGKILGLVLSDDRCEILLDFLVESSCKDSCLPFGVCVELDNEQISNDLGERLPSRKGCRALEPGQQPRCLDASVMGIGMGMDSHSAMPMTSYKETSLLFIFNSAFYAYVEFTPEDFTVTGPPGTYIKSVSAAMPHNKHNVAYTIKIVHGATTDTKTIKICFSGTKKIRTIGTPYDADTTICAYYHLSTYEPDREMASVMLHEGAKRTPVCMPHGS